MVTRATLIVGPPAILAHHANPLPPLPAVRNVSGAPSGATLMTVTRATKAALLTVTVRTLGPASAFLTAP